METGADRYGELWADVYDDEHSYMVPSESQLDLLSGLAGDGRALELGIGTGRVALPLADRGVLIEGVDASTAMVARMRAKPGGDSMQVAIGDMCDPPNDGPFRLVFVVFNTLFGLPTQQAQVDCFQAAADLLEPGGAFCLECFVPDLRRFDDGQSLRTLSLDEKQVRVDAARHEPVNQIVESNLVTIRHEQPLTVRAVTLRYAWPSELDLMAQLAGLALRNRWADWDRSDFDSTSGFHISIYQK